MKNSLFKRAIAAAAAVPLALTQCLTYANAVTNDTAIVQAQSQESTLNAILAIPGDSTNFNKEGNQVSQWEATATSLLGDAAGKTGSINVKQYADKVIANAGSFKEAADYFLNDLLGDVKYTVQTNGDIVITGNIAEPDWNKILKNTPADALNQIADSYSASGLKNIDYSDVKVGGEFTITVKTSQLQLGKEISVEAVYDINGKKYNLGQLIQFANDTLDKIENIGNAEIDKQVAADKTEEAKSKYAAKIQFIRDKFVKAENALDKVLAYSFSETSKDASGNAAKVIAKANDFIKSHGFNKQLPPTATDIAADSRVANAFAKISTITNGKAELSASEVGAFIDSLGYREIVKDGSIAKSTPASAEIANGKGEFVAAFDDNADEQAVLKAALAKDGYDLVGSYKKITAKVDFSQAKKSDTVGSINLNIERLFVTDTTTTTTSATTSSSTTTTTTSSDTTTSVSTDTTTSTSTNTNTTTSTTSDTTSSTTSTSSNTTTSTTSDTTSSSTTTTTSKKVSKVYAKTGYTTTAAFYLNTEEEFNKGQISGIVIVTEYNDGTKEEKTVSADSISFGTATPSNTYKKDTADFKYNVPVYVDGQKIADSEGKDITVEAYIGVRGDANLDSTADAVDASTVLSYYAALSTNGNTPSRTKLADSSSLVTSARSIYDDFAAYLCDVQHDVKFTNLTGKIERNKTINAVDASAILDFYARRQQKENANKSDAAIWTEVDKNTNNKDSEEKTEA